MLHWVRQLLSGPNGECCTSSAPVKVEHGVNFILMMHIKVKKGHKEVHCKHILCTSCWSLSVLHSPCIFSLSYEVKVNPLNLL